VKGEVRLWRNHGQETSRPVGSGRSPHHDDRRSGGAGAWAGTQQATSYRDLLDPIPNALPPLKADDERLAQSGDTKTAQVVIGHDHHHYHHHAARVYVRVGREPIVTITITTIVGTDEA
jgi:hypothetical protein